MVCVRQEKPKPLILFSATLIDLKIMRRRLYVLGWTDGHVFAHWVERKRRIIQCRTSNNENTSTNDFDKLRIVRKGMRHRCSKLLRHCYVRYPQKHAHLFKGHVFRRLAVYTSLLDRLWRNLLLFIRSECNFRTMTYDPLKWLHTLTGFRKNEFWSRRKYR